MTYSFIQTYLIYLCFTLWGFTDEADFADIYCGGLEANAQDLQR